MKKLIDKTLLSHGETIAVAISGGKDSVCLLHILLSLKNELNLTVKAVHVDHSIRGKESERDASFVKKLCENLSVPLKVFKVDAVRFSEENHLSLEQGARLLRYQIFDNLLSENYADKIATAHHKNDCFETLLFNIFRGSGLSGASAIKSTNGKIIRPLLSVTREKISEYIEENNLSFVDDSTNLDSAFTRNFIRNELTPKILERFPDAINSSFRFSKIASEEDEFLTELTKTCLEKKGEDFYLKLSTPTVLFRRASIMALKDLGLEKDYEYQHVLSIENLKNSQSGAVITLPKNITATREYDYVIFSKNSPVSISEELPFSVNAFEFNGKKIIITDGDLDKPYLLFDKDKIPSGAVIRTRRDGDVFTKFGGGTKKLKEYFIDKKIPLSQRDSIPIVAKGNVVYLIIGVEISDLVRVDNDTKTKLKVKFD